MKLSSVNEKDFCSEFGIAFSDVENKLFKTEPNPCKYFNKNGIKSGPFAPLYFSAVSLIIRDATNVLEIGIGFGRTTNLLASLFPKSIIYAVDIPIDDIHYKKETGRAHLKEEFDRNMGRDNIKFFEKNSFFLPSMSLPRDFDLIYVDGDHYYPILACDATFTYNNLRPGGFAFFHDYGDGNAHVESMIKHMNSVIDEEIKLFLNASPSDGRSVAWFRKSMNGEK